MKIDISTVLGIICAFGILIVGIVLGNVTSVFINIPGFLLVIGGTTAAMLINTPLDLLADSASSLKILFTGQEWTKLRPVISMLTTASQEVHKKGLGALQTIDRRVGGGFPAKAAQVAMEFNNPEYVSTVLDNEVTEDLNRKNEIVNVFRTMSVLLPMFGLVGTLIGIIDVLKHIANPEQVGAAMAIAVTTAFYGILIANLVAIPLAGKLRIRYSEEYLMKKVVIEAITQMAKGTVPIVIERRMQAYLVDK